MKTLVTGAAGFIGSHLCEALLREGHEVVGIDNFDEFYPREIKVKNLQPSLSQRNFTFFERDIGSPDAFESIPNNIYIVIHLAAKAGVLPSLKNPAGYIETNIQGTLNVLEWMRKNDIKKLVFASSSSVYGNNKKVPFAENDNVDNPISPYAFTKKSCELLNYTYHHLYDFSIINLRFFTVYGPRQRPDLAIHKFVKALYSNNPITLYGKGDTARDYTFINDIIAGITKAISFVCDKPALYEIINLGNSSPVRLNELITAVSESTGIKPDIQHHPKQAGDVEITYADISKAQRLLNYSPLTSLKKGINAFTDWYKKEYLGS